MIGRGLEMRKLLGVIYINLMCGLVGIWSVYVRPYTY